MASIFGEEGHGLKNEGKYIAKKDYQSKLK